MAGHAPTILQLIKRRSTPQFPTDMQLRICAVIRERAVQQHIVEDFMQKFASKPSLLKSFICTEWPSWSPCKSEETMVIGDSQGTVSQEIIPNYSPELASLINFASIRGVTQEAFNHAEGFNLEWTFETSHRELASLSDVPPYRLCGKESVQKAFEMTCFAPLIATAIGLIGIRGETLTTSIIILPLEHEKKYPYQ